MSNEVFIKIIAEHIVSEVLSQTEDRTFEWLDNRIRELISQVAGMGIAIFLPSVTSLTRR